MPNLPTQHNQTLTILDLFVRGECVTAQEVVDKTGYSKLQVMRVMSNPIFVDQYGKLTKEAARVEFDSVKYSALMEIIRNSESNKEKIAAIKTMESMFTDGEGNKGNTKSGGTIEGIIHDMDEDEELVLGIKKRSNFKGLE